MLSLMTEEEFTCLYNWVGKLMWLKNELKHFKRKEATQVNKNFVKDSTTVLQNASIL